MANLFTRHMIATMDPMGDAKALGPERANELLHVDAQRLKSEAHRISTPVHSRALAHFPAHHFRRSPGITGERAVQPSPSLTRPATAPPQQRGTLSTHIAAPKSAPGAVSRPMSAARLMAPSSQSCGHEVESRVFPAAPHMPEHSMMNGIVNFWQKETRETRQTHLEAEMAADRSQSMQKLGDARADAHGLDALHRKAPEWWSVPKPVLAASKSFDDLHQQRLTRANRLRFAVEQRPGSLQKQHALRKETSEVFATRYVAPVVHRPAPVANREAGNGRRKRAPPGLQADLVHQRAEAQEPAEKPFSLGASIWAPRAKWADSQSLHDTAKVGRMRFAIDWQCALEQLDLSRVISENSPNIAVGGAAPTEEELDAKVQEVGAVLMECSEHLFLCYTFYATVGDGDFMRMSFSDFSLFVEDHALIAKRFKYCQAADLEALFFGITSAAPFSEWREIQEAARTAGSLGGSDRRGELSRVQFVGALVHVAIARYIKSRELSNVATAVHRLITRDILPRSPSCAIMGPDAFRIAHCYTAETSEVLAKHDGALRSIFHVIASGGRSSKLLGIDEWCRYLDGVGFMAADLSPREARLAFVWSRTAVIDGRTGRGRLREVQIPFEGFMEAICRVAIMKSLPLDDEVEAFGERNGFTHAGGYMAWASGRDAVAFADFVRQRTTPWGVENRYQPTHRCVDHVIAMMIHAMQPKPAGDKDEDTRRDDLDLSEKEAIAWKHSQQKLRAQGAMLGVRRAQRFVLQRST
jgi:hypothetical protein